MKNLYKRFNEIENLVRHGQVTISEGNRMMLQAIGEHFSEYVAKDDISDWEWDSIKAYHNTTRKADAHRAAGASPAALRGGRSWVIPKTKRRTAT